MNVTKNLSRYIKEKRVNLSELPRKTGIPYSSLYASLGGEGRERELRANELTAVCFILKINPMDFADFPEKTETAERR